MMMMIVVTLNIVNITLGFFCTRAELIIVRIFGEVFVIAVRGW